MPPISGEPIKNFHGRGRGPPWPPPQLLEPLMCLLSLESASCLAQFRPRREEGPAGKSRAVLMGVEAPQRAGLPKGRKARPCPSLDPPQEGEKGSLQEGRKKTSSASASGLRLTRPQDGGDCWCQGGVVSAESRNVGRPPPWKEKSIKSPGAPAPPPSPLYEKVQNIITKRDLREALGLGS